MSAIKNNKTRIKWIKIEYLEVITLYCVVRKGVI